jgi:hypothetical protein
MLATGGPVVPRPDDDADEYGSVGGMRVDRGKRNNEGKPAPVQLYPPQIPHEMTRAAGSRRLITRNMTRPW